MIPIGDKYWQSRTGKEKAYWESRRATSLGQDWRRDPITFIWFWRAMFYRIMLPAGLWAGAWLLYSASTAAAAFFLARRDPGNAGKYLIAWMVLMVATLVYRHFRARGQK